MIGAPLTEVNGFDSGQAHVLFGSRSSFGSQYEIDAFNGNNGFRINGAAASDVAGNWVSSAGDVNNDGYDDLIVGSKGTQYALSDEDRNYC